MKYIQSQIQILDQTDIQRIHQATLEVLATVGCRMPHPRVLALMQEAGADVDAITGVIRFPSQLIEHVIRSTTEGSPVKRSADPPRPLMPIRNGGFRIHPGNQANIIDYRAVSRRPGTVEDVIKGIVLCNELPFVGSCMPLVTPADVPAFMGDLYGYYLCTLYSKKPYSVYILSPESACQIIRIGELVHDEPARAHPERFEAQRYRSW